MNHEGITDFRSLIDFDKETIPNLPRVCKQKIDAIAEDLGNNITAAPEVPGVNISSISVQRLIVAYKAAKYYHSISKSTTTGNMHYSNILANFKIECEVFESMKKEDNDRKIIRWSSIFLNYIEYYYGVKGSFRYVLQDEVTVKTELDDLLTDHVVATYCWSSRIILRRKWKPR